MGYESRMDCTSRKGTFSFNASSYMPKLELIPLGSFGRTSLVWTYRCNHQNFNPALLSANIPKSDIPETGAVRDHIFSLIHH